MNPKQLMKQVQQMQEQMQQRMTELRVEGSAGGGMVKATMNGHKSSWRSPSIKKRSIPTTWKCCRTSSSLQSTKPPAKWTRRCRDSWAR